MNEAKYVQFLAFFENIFKEIPTRAVVGSPHNCISVVQTLQTKVREDFAIIEKAPRCPFSIVS